MTTSAEKPHRRSIPVRNFYARSAHVPSPICCFGEIAEVYGVQPDPSGGLTDGARIHHGLEGSRQSRMQSSASQVEKRVMNGAGYLPYERTHSYNSSGRPSGSPKKV